MLIVQRVTLKEVRDWLLLKHYARSIPSVSHAFGLFDNKVMVGAVTYGTPPSPPLRVGVCGPEYASVVTELNRLIVRDSAPVNTASRLVGQSLRLLPKPAIVISFADTSQGHVGYVYQAANFLYTGLSAKRTNWKVRGLGGKHSISIADISRGRKDRAAYMRQRFGDDFYLEPRSRKHRYVYFLGNRKQRQAMRAALRYPVMPYPKGETRRYAVQWSAEEECAIQDKTTP